MRDGSHTSDQLLRGRCGFRRKCNIARLHNPNTGFDMQRAVVARICDLLKVGQSIQRNIILAKPTIRNRGPDRRYRKRFFGLIELEIEIGLIVKIRTGDQIKSITLPGPGKIAESTQLLVDRMTVRGYAN